MEDDTKIDLSLYFAIILIANGVFVITEAFTWARLLVAFVMFIIAGILTKYHTYKVTHSTVV